MGSRLSSAAPEMLDRKHNPSTRSINESRCYSRTFRSMNIVAFMRVRNSYARMFLTFYIADIQRLHNDSTQIKMHSAGSLRLCSDINQMQTIDAYRT